MITPLQRRVVEHARTMVRNVRVVYESGWLTRHETQIILRGHAETARSAWRIAKRPAGPPPYPKPVGMPMVTAAS